jgi:hypothetical protein
MSKLDKLIDEIRHLPPTDRERLLDEVQHSPDSASTALPGAHDALLGMAGTKHLAEVSRTRSGKTVR